MIPLDDLLGRTVQQDGHEWTIVYSRDLGRLVLERKLPISQEQVLEMLRTGALFPQTTAAEIRARSLPKTRALTLTEIAYVEATLEGSAAGRMEVDLVEAYHERLFALQLHLARLPDEG